MKLAPRIVTGTMVLYVAGALWVALWHGRARFWGLLPAALAAILIIRAPVPDILITRDGRDIGVANETERLLVLRDTEESYAQDNLLELAGSDREPIVLDSWRGSRCSAEFCAFALERGGRDWSVLVARNHALVEERALAAACGKADIVIAARFLPRSCRPRWLKADRGFLMREGGTAVYLASRRVETVGQDEGEHGWWRASLRQATRPRPSRRSTDQ